MSPDEVKIEIENMLRASANKPLSPEDVQEAMSLIDAIKSNPRTNAPTFDKSREAIIMNIMSEQDWRKKAALCAMLISKSLE